MAEKMKIVVDSIESKLNEQSFANFKEIAVAAISKCIEAIKKFEASGQRRDLTFCKNNQAEESINAHFLDIIDRVNNSDARQVIDALRHSFSCYAYNGLHQLYSRQENECWHPKIVLTEVLEPNDIDSLPRTFTIYRGCDIGELENRSFGQAWSTSLESAKKFAYTHYKNEDWFNESSRIVLKSKFSRDHVLFSNQTVEYEVVVDVDKLGVVHKHA